MVSHSRESSSVEYSLFASRPRGMPDRSTGMIPFTRGLLISLETTRAMSSSSLMGTPSCYSCSLIRSSTFRLVSKSSTRHILWRPSCTSSNDEIAFFALRSSQKMPTYVCLLGHWTNIATGTSSPARRLSIISARILRLRPLLNGSGDSAATGPLISAHIC